MTSLKTCFKCKTEKPLVDFYRHSGMHDGYLNKCKKCTRSDVFINYVRKIEQYREYDRARALLPKRKSMLARNTRKKRASMPGYMRAHNAVARALKSGKLLRQPCQMCGSNSNIHAHHDDYARPLEVMWLCPEHHASRHSFLRERVLLGVI